jgi:hypothetical protein
MDDTFRTYAFSLTVETKITDHFIRMFLTELSIFIIGMVGLVTVNLFNWKWLFIRYGNRRTIDMIMDWFIWLEIMVMVVIA